MSVKKKLKLPVRKDGGCHHIFGGTIVCTTTTTGILKKKHMKLIGKGLIVIEAEKARVITAMFEQLKPDHMLAYAEEVSKIVKEQLCTWCDGCGWQAVNAMENIVACSHCKGKGLEPAKKGRKNGKA